MLGNRILLALTLVFFALTATPATVNAQVEEQSFKVIGTWSSLSAWKNFEEPLWTKWLPDASGGKIKGQPISISEAGLKGYEVVRLLKLNVFDFAHGLVGYVAKGNGLIEAGDLAGMAQDFDTLKKIVTAYRPTLNKTFEDTFGAKIVALHPWPPSLVYCTSPISGPSDLAGKKVRVHSASLGDYVEGAGGTSVTMSFGEVLPSLQKGVVDCAITDAMSAYRGKWHEVIKYVMDTKLAYSLSFTAVNITKWNSLDDATKKIMMETFATLEEKAWAGAISDDKNGVNCLTSGPCPVGEPGGAIRVALEGAALKAHQDILQNAVLKEWAMRCPECVDTWNSTAGKAAGLTAPKF